MFNNHLFVLSLLLLGWRHRESYRNYYQQFYPQWAMGHTAYLQSQGVMPMPMPGMPGMPPAPFMGMPPPQSADGQRLQPLPFPPGMQNPPPMFRPPPSFAPPPSAHST